MEIDAFKDCTQLETLDLPPTLKEIKSEAFFNCNSILTPLVLENIEQIGADAFIGCPFKTIKIGKNIKFIAENAFGFTNHFKDGGEPIFIEDLVVNGYADTYAQTYAEKYGLRFVDLNTQPEYTTDDRFDYSKFIAGDVTLDGEVNIDDVTAVQRYVVGMSGLEPVQQSNAIVKYLNEISIENATVIQQYLSGVIDTLEETGTG